MVTRPLPPGRKEFLPEEAESAPCRAGTMRSGNAGVFRETGVCGNERAAWVAPWVIWPMCPMGFPSCVLPGKPGHGGPGVSGRWPWVTGSRFHAAPVWRVLQLGQLDLLDVGSGRRPVLVGGNGVPDDRGLRPYQYGVSELGRHTRGCCGSRPEGRGRGRPDMGLGGNRSQCQGCPGVLRGPGETPGLHSFKASNSERNLRSHLRSNPRRSPIRKGIVLTFYPQAWVCAKLRISPGMNFAQNWGNRVW